MPLNAKRRICTRSWDAKRPAESRRAMVCLSNDPSGVLASPIIVDAGSWVSAPT